MGIAQAVSVVVKSKVAAAALATVVAAGAVGTGATVAANQGVFGQQVKTQVQTCKAALKSGEHGIGQCVSTFASKHGQDERNQHSQSQNHGASSNASSHGASSNAGSHGASSDSHPSAGNAGASSDASSTGSSHSAGK